MLFTNNPCRTMKFTRKNNLNLHTMFPVIVFFQSGQKAIIVKRLPSTMLEYSDKFIPIKILCE